jgi:hypothetical protein
MILSFMHLECLFLRSQEPANSRDPGSNERVHGFESHISKIKFTIILLFLRLIY